MRARALRIRHRLAYLRWRLRGRPGVFVFGNRTAFPPGHYLVMEGSFFQECNVGTPSNITVSGCTFEDVSLHKGENR